MVRITFAVVMACKSHPPHNTQPNHSILTSIPVAVSAMALTPNVSGAKDVGNGKAQQFTTGGCTSDADCRSTCCAEISASGLGICSAVGASTQNGKLGCGFTDPNAAVSSCSYFAVVYLLLIEFAGYYRCCQGPGR